MRLPSPRGALRLLGAPADVLLIIEPGRYLAEPESRAADYTSIAGSSSIPGDQTAAEFYGLDVGSRRGYLEVGPRASRWFEFEIRENSIAELNCPPLLERHSALFEVRRDGQLVKEPATLRLMGPGIDHLARWEGEALDLWPRNYRLEAVGLRFKGTTEASAISAGGLFPLESSPAGDCWIDLPSLGREFALECAPEGAAADVQFFAYGSLENAPIEVDVVQAETLPDSPQSYTHLSGCLPGSRRRVDGLADGIVQVGLGAKGDSSIRFWRPTQAAGLRFSGLSAALPEPMSRAALVAAKSDALLGGDNIPILIGPWRSLPLQSTEPSAPALAGDNGSSDAQPEPISWTRQAAPAPLSRVEAPPALLQRQSPAGGTQAFETAETPRLLLDWQRACDLLGLQPEGLGMNSLGVHVWPGGEPLHLEQDSRLEVAMPAEGWFELEGQAQGMVLWGWFTRGELKEAGSQRGPGSGQAEIRLVDRSGQGLRSLQFERARLEWTPGLPTEIRLLLSAPACAAWTGVSKSRAEGVVTELMPGDVLEVQHD